MKYTKEERQEIGRQIYEHELTCRQAAEEYGIHIHTAKRWIVLANDENTATLISKYGLDEFDKLEVVSSSCEEMLRLWNSSQFQSVF